MDAILSALFNPILPIFFISVVGFALGKLGQFNYQDAGILNRYVVMIGAPTLNFSFFADAPFDEFKWGLVAIFALASIIVYATGALAARFIFGLGPRESLLLGMASCLTNHVFFVLPIAVGLFGPAAELPVIAIITFDVLVMFGGTFFVMDLLSKGSVSPLAIITVLLKNPVIMSILIGLTIGLLKIPVHAGILKFADFAGASAAPVAMFALGVTLSSANLARFDLAAFFATCLKLFIHPLLFFFLAFGILGLAPSGGDLWIKAIIFTAAGPCAAMPFVIALQHGIETSRLVKAVVYSTILSLFTLAVLSSL